VTDEQARAQDPASIAAPGSTPSTREGWGTPKPATIPRPTYAPAGLAFGITFLFWGFITSPIVGVAGFVVTAASLYAWIREMRQS